MHEHEVMTIKTLDDRPWQKTQSDRLVAADGPSSEAYEFGPWFECETEPWLSVWNRSSRDSLQSLVGKLTIPW